jgi:hypothetical protein
MFTRPRLGVCAIFKNEAPYLPEWIAYHLAVGVDHFVLYDNASTDGGAALIRNTPFRHHVTIEDWPQPEGQLPAYRHFLAHHAARFDWAAFIDLDEFLLPLGDDSVPALLGRMSGFSAVLSQWRVFGPSGWDSPPDGLCIEAYHLRAPDDAPVSHHVKTILRCTEALAPAANPHEFQLLGSPCDPLGRPVPNIGIQPEACHEGLVINHYHTRSRAEWHAKIRRGSAMFGNVEPRYPRDLIDHFADLCRIEDRTITAWAPAVRALLGQSAIKESQATVFRDLSRPGAPWQAALRDPDSSRLEVLRDAHGRTREFPTDAAARAAALSRQ